MTSVNTNLNAQAAQHALQTNQRHLDKAMAQLSTGSRINSAADDAAGASMAAIMATQVRSLNQAVRNANDGISLLLTADSAVGGLQNVLNRMREVAIQSANDTNTSDDRNYLNLEFQQLKAEANRITESTEWNGMKVLDGSYAGNGASNKGLFKFQIGANGNQSIELTIGKAGYGVSSGTATLAQTTAAAAATKQKSTLTLAGTYAEGDTVTVDIAGKSHVYTVTKADVSGANDAANHALIATSLAGSINKDSSFSHLTVAASTTTVTFEAKVVNLAFDDSKATQSVSSGNLGSIRLLDVSTMTNSNNAIVGLDNALKNINMTRAELGAKVNRLTHASDNLSQVSLNTSASRSRIMDTDYAQATADMARAMILNQAGSAMLSQANQQPMYVLALLR